MILTLLFKEHVIPPPPPHTPHPGYEPTHPHRGEGEGEGQCVKDNRALNTRTTPLKYRPSCTYCYFIFTAYERSFSIDRTLNRKYD